MPTDQAQSTNPDTEHAPGSVATHNDQIGHHELSPIDAPGQEVIESEPSSASSDRQQAVVTRGALKLEGWRLYLTLPSVLIALLLATMDSSIVSPALVTIGNDYGNFVQTIWIVLGYLLSYMTFTMLWSRLSDIFGRKIIFVASLICLLAFSIGCGRAQSLNDLIAFRVLQGLGGSGIYSLGNIVLPEITPDKWYAYMISAQGAIFTLANVLGPVLGGIISSTTTWRWIFYLNIPGCGVLLPVVIIAWKDNELPETFKARLNKACTFDFLGLLFLTSLVCCVVVAIQLGGSFYAPWTSSAVLGVFIGALVSLIAIVAWNQYREAIWHRSKIGPLFPARLMSIRVVSGAFLLCTLCGFDLFLAIVAIPERFQILNGDSSLQAALRLIPFLAVSALGSTICGIIISRRNIAFEISLLSSCFLLLGAGLLSIRPIPGSVDAGVYGYQVLYGLGTGGLLSSTAYISGMNSGFEDYALASGIISQCRILGGCIGLTLFTVVLNEVFSGQLKNVLQPQELQQLRQSLNTIMSMSESKQAAIESAFAEAFVQQFRMAAYVAALSIIVSFACWTKHPVALKKRLEVAEKISQGEISLEEGDRLVRGW